MVDPKRIRGFITSEVIRAKTDKIDASMIALFASQKKPKYIKISPSEEDELFSTLNQRRFNLVRILATEKVRIKHPATIYCIDQIKALMKILEAEIKDIDAEINKMIKNNPKWSAQKDIITSMPGMGNICSGDSLKRQVKGGRCN